MGELLHLLPTGARLEVFLQTDAARHQEVWLLVQPQNLWCLGRSVLAGCRAGATGRGTLSGRLAVLGITLGLLELDASHISACC